MKYSFPVLIVDDAGDPVTGARVCLVQKSTLAGQEHPYPKVAATHSDAGDGKYDDQKSIAMAEGAWVLIATLKGRSPVVQPIKVTIGGDGGFILTQWPQPAATVQITPTRRKVSGDTLKEFTSHVTLWPVSELVFIAGLDYNRKKVSKGTQFHLYAFDRAEVLARENKINPGTVATIFSTSQIWRKKRVRGLKGWFDVERLQLGDPSARVLVDPPAKYQPVSGLDIHVKAFYTYLADVGKREPKSVKELGIFSHSWPGGPILYDSYEGDAYKKSPNRDPNDFDCRPKDFNSTNFPAYRTMIDALAPGCRFQIWGCSATTLFKDRAVAALHAMKKGQPEDSFFTVDTPIVNSHVRPHVLESREIEHTSELRHRYEMDRLFRSGPYAAQAAKTLGIEVRAGCPGTGSNLRIIEGLQAMKVEPGEYRDVFEYYHRRFGPEFAETHDKWDSGYVDYHAIQGRKPVPRPPFSMRYFYIEIAYVVDETKDVPHYTIRFDRPGKPPLRHNGTKITVTASEQRGLGIPLSINGQLVVLEDKDPRQSRAFYVQEDQRVFLVARDPFTNKWTLRVKEM